MRMIYKIGVLLTCLHGSLQAMEEESFSLHDAVRAGDVDRVRSLLDGNADPNARDHLNMAPLHWVCMFDAQNYGQKEMVDLLLQHKAEVGLKVSIPLRKGGKGKFRPLNLAVSTGKRLSVVKLLLKAGADPKKTITREWDELEGTVKSHPEIVELLLKRGAESNCRLLFGAAEYGHCDLVALLLDQKVDPNVHDSLDRTPLQVAAENGHVVVVRQLLDGGADMTLSDKERKVLMDYAFEHGLQRFLDSRAEIDLKGEEGSCALDHAVYNNQCSLARFLIVRGARVRLYPHEARSLWHDSFRLCLQLPDVNYVGMAKLLLPADQYDAERKEPSPTFPLNLFVAKKSPHSSQDRITTLQCLCTFSKERSKSGLFSCLSKEQQLPPLPPLPVELQNHIISYLPEDIYSPRLLARVCNYLYATYPERITGLINRIARSLFINALKKDTGSPMKRMVVDLSVDRATDRASHWCFVDDDAPRCWIIPHTRGAFSYGLPMEELQKLLDLEDTDGERAAFIRRKIEKEFKNLP